MKIKSQRNSLVRSAASFAFAGAWLLAPFASGQSLLHHYPLDTNGNDQIGTANLSVTGTGNNAANVASGGVAGGYFTFDGAGDALSTDSGSGLFGTWNGVVSDPRPVTISLWVNSPSPTTNNVAFGLSSIETATAYRNTSILIGVPASGTILRPRENDTVANGITASTAVITPNPTDAGGMRCHRHRSLLRGV